MPTMTNPNPCIGSAVLDNAPDGSALFRALGGHYTSPAQAVCEFIDDSLSSIAANGDEVGEVFLRVTDRGELVELSVTDSGSGIADLGAALTISDRSIAQTPYNEHGCGLKSALSHLCGGAEDWSIETRTAADAAADRYRCVSAPYAAVNAHMTERIYAGSGDIPWVTGTIVRLRCPMSRFAQLKPANRRTPADFCQLVDYLAEELRYTYAPLLASGKLLLSILRCEQNGHEQLLALDALEPEWDGDAVELPETKLDLGGGPVTVRCRYGLIIKSKGNAVYYRGNMASSGFEIRLNGRAVAHGLLAAVYGKATHPSGNRFLAQVDLLSGDGAALERFLKARFDGQLESRQGKIRQMTAALDWAIPFLTDCFGDGQELTLLITGITGSKGIMAFIARHGSDSYLALCGRLQCQKNEAQLQELCRQAVEKK